MENILNMWSNLGSLTSPKEKQIDVKYPLIWSLLVT